MHAVFAHNVDGVVNPSIGDAVDDQRPVCTTIVCAVDVWTGVVQAMAINSNIRSVHIETRRLDHSNLRPGAQLLRRHVLPMLTIVASAPDQAVIRACPDEPPVE